MPVDLIKLRGWGHLGLFDKDSLIEHNLVARISGPLSQMWKAIWGIDCKRATELEETLAIIYFNSFILKMETEA